MNTTRYYLARARRRRHAIALQLEAGVPAKVLPFRDGLLNVRARVAPLHWRHLVESVRLMWRSVSPGAVYIAACIIGALIAFRYAWRLAL